MSPESLRGTHFERTAGGFEFAPGRPFLARYRTTFWTIRPIPGNQNHSPRPARLRPAARAFVLGFHRIAGPGGGGAPVPVGAGRHRIYFNLKKRASSASERERSERERAELALYCL